MSDGMSGTSSCAGHRQTEWRIKKSEKGGMGLEAADGEPGRGDLPQFFLVIEYRLDDNLFCFFDGAVQFSA